jgi:hypothetical protein
LATLAQCRPNLSQNFLHYAFTQRRHLTLDRLRNGVSHQLFDSLFRHIDPQNQNGTLAFWIIG